jgi:hypothetical protein
MKFLIPLILVLSSVLAHATPPPPPPPPKGTAKAKVQIHAQIWSYDASGKYNGGKAFRCDKQINEIEYPVYEGYNGSPNYFDNIICEAVIDDKKVEVELGLVHNETTGKQNFQSTAIFRSEDVVKDYNSSVLERRDQSINVKDLKGMSYGIEIKHEMKSKSGTKYTIDGSIWVELAE